MTELSTEPRRIPPKALAALQAMKAQMMSYLRGVLDGMGIEGEFQLDENTGEVVSVGKERKKEGGK